MTKQDGRTVLRAAPPRRKGVKTIAVQMPDELYSRLYLYCQQKNISVAEGVRRLVKILPEAGEKDKI